MNLKRYLTIYAALWKNSVARELSFKGNFILLIVLGVWLLLAAAPPACRAADGTSQLPPQLLAFSADKEQQAQRLAADLKLEVSPDIWVYFKAATQGDWPGVTNAYARLRWRSSQYQGSYNDPTVSSPVWQTIIEVQTAYEAFAAGGTKYPLAFGEGIIQSIPAGSIYFGGTDPGRGLVTALCESHAQAKPFYTLTQNALADGRYLDYLRSMYGSRIYIPTTNDSQNAFQEYTKDVSRRFSHDRDLPNEPKQVKPGEDVHIANGRVQVSGQVAVMSINALLVKVIFNHNTNCEFYVEESFPLDWMYPYLSPNGLIFKLNHEPLPVLTKKMMDTDHVFWTKQVGSMLGDWLEPETPVSNVCAFVESAYVQKDWSHFTGDMEFVTNNYAMKAFSKLRSSSGGIYQWRLASKTDAGDKARLRAEADYAFRQSFAMCPTSPEAVYRYVNFLLSESRLNDGILIVRTARKMEPENEQFISLLSQLLDARKQKNNIQSTEGTSAQGQLQKLATEAVANPTNFQNILALGGLYRQMQDTNRATKLFNQSLEMFDEVLANPNITPENLTAMAQIAAMSGNLPKLEIVMEKLVVLKPDGPEEHYDLAALKAVLGKKSEAIANLKKALELNSKRLQTNPSSRDLSTLAAKDSRFNSLKNNPEFQSLLSP
jgi:tetratricopeptide (TPR) repeat protein